MAGAAHTKKGFFEGYLALVLEPFASLREFLEEKRPPFIVAVYSIFLLTLSIPFCLEYALYGSSFQTFVYSRLFFAVLTLSVLSLLAFIFLEMIFLLLLRMRFSLSHLIALAGYVLVPVVLGIWCTLIANYALEKRLTLISRLVTGTGTLTPEFSLVLSWCWLGICVYVFILFCYGLWIMTNSYFFTAVLVSFLSLLPLSTSLLMGLIAGSTVQPKVFSSLIETLKERTGIEKALENVRNKQHLPE